MTRLRLFLLLLVSPVLTVPWGFTDFTGWVFLGFPAWALYSTAACFGYALLVAVCVGRYWTLSARDEPLDDP